MGKALRGKLRGRAVRLSCAAELCCRAVLSSAVELCGRAVMTSCAPMEHSFSKKGLMLGPPTLKQIPNIRRALGRAAAEDLKMSSSPSTSNTTLYQPGCLPGRRARA